jgi:P4 family phage/plasmid primase-like protien
LSQELLKPNDYANYWRYEIGVNVIPAFNKTKKPKVSWKEWQTKLIPQELHDEWIRQEKFNDGLAIVCGETFHISDDYWINAIDCDSKQGIDDFIKNNTLEEIAKDTLVEQHNNKEKCHILFYTKEPLHNETVGKIEIKSKGKHLLYCAGGIHKDGSAIKIIGTNKPSIVDIEWLESKIDSIKTKYGKTIPKLKPDPIHKVDKTLNEGDNRGQHILSYLDSMRLKNPEFDESTLFELARQYERNNCSDSYSNDKINELVLQAINFTDEKRAERKKRQQNPNEIDIYKIAAKLMSEYDFRTLEKSKDILFYSDGKYREGGEEVISKRSRKITENIKLHHIREIQGIIRDETGYISHDEFDKDSHIINLKQGLFNLKTGTIKEHSPDYLSRVRIPIYYNSKATCPRFDKFLDSSLESDEKKIRTVLEMIAYTLIKDSSLLQKAFMNTGKGSNGKSVLFDINFAMLGKENVSAKTIHDFQTNRFATSALENKLANICADVGNRGLTETEALKKIISGDVLDCERKGKEGYTFVPYATLIFSANEIPEVSDESEAFARRFELIEWTKQFYDKDRDKTVKTIRKDKNELSGIFNKLIPIAKYLLQEEKMMYESNVQDARKKWLEKSDSVGQFLNNVVIDDIQNHTQVSTVKSQYHKFCIENNFRPVTPVKFNDKLEERGYERDSKSIDGKTTKVWLGFVLNNLML